MAEGVLAVAYGGAEAGIEMKKIGIDPNVGDRQSFAKALQRPLQQPKFRLPLRKPEKINGELGIVFSDMEMDRVAEDLKFALVLKFSSSRPSIDVLRLHIIKAWGFSEVPMVSFMDDYHVLLHLANEKDYVHAWAREGRIIAGCQFRLFNWTVDFDVKKEPSIVPQWIFLPGLPLHLYRLDCLQSLSSRFGKFLGTDNATLYRTRATGARICVEVDLQDEMVKGFPIVVGQKNHIWQDVVYEKRGFYCTKCFRQGHTSVVCRVGMKPKQKPDLVKGGKQGNMKDDKTGWKVVGKKNKTLEEGEVEVVGDDSGVSKEGAQVIDIGKQVINEECQPDNGIIRCAAEDNPNIEKVPMIDKVGDDEVVSENVEVVNVKNVSEEEVENIAGEKFVVHSEDEIRCQNSFEVLSEEETAMEVECEKDYCSDPGGCHGNSVGMDSKGVAVRKSRRTKVQPIKLSL